MAAGRPPNRQNRPAAPPFSGKVGSIWYRSAPEALLGKKYESGNQSGKWVPSGDLTGWQVGKMASRQHGFMARWLAGSTGLN
jgi:hypothetical protein